MRVVSRNGSQSGEPHSPSRADLKATAKEASIALDAAVAAAEMLALHGITQSGTYDRMYEMLKQAADAVAKLVEDLE